MWLLWLNASTDNLLKLPEVTDWTAELIIEYYNSMLFTQMARLWLFSCDLVENLGNVWHWTDVGDFLRQNLTLCWPPW